MYRLKDDHHAEESESISELPSQPLESWSKIRHNRKISKIEQSEALDSTETYDNYVTTNSNSKRLSSNSDGETHSKATFKPLTHRSTSDMRTIDKVLNYLSFSEESDNEEELKSHVLKLPSTKGKFSTI